MKKALSKRNERSGLKTAALDGEIFIRFIWVRAGPSLMEAVHLAILDHATQVRRFRQLAYCFSNDIHT